MQKNHMAEVQKSLAGLANLFQKTPPNGEALVHWWETLKEFDINDIMTTLGYWARDNSKMPTPHDVWKTLNDSRTDKLEQKARYEASENRQPIGRNSGWAPTEYGKRMLKEMIAMLSEPGPDKKRWAYRLKEREERGEKLPYISKKMWRDVVDNK
jgi:hypothetical protein